MTRPGELVGRAAELARLRAFASSGGSGFRLLVVTGEAGIGKTRLVDELVAGVGRATTVVRCRADEHDITAFGMWRGALRQLDLPHPDTDAALPPSEQRWELIGHLSDALRSATPALLVLDDLHWADDDSLWVLEQLLDQPVEGPLPVVAATRPGSDVRTPRWHALYRRGEVVGLEGLDAGEVAALAASLGGDTSLSAVTCERAGGNPLFVRELVLARGVALPATVGALLTQSIDHLGDAVADVVSLASLAGPRTPPEVLAAAAGVPIGEVEQSLDIALRADLLRLDDGGVRFRHDLVSEAASSRLSVLRRQRMQLALADGWSAVTGAEAGLRSARHRLLAVPSADAEDAAAGAMSAAEVAIERGQVIEAAALLEIAGRVVEDRTDVPSGTKARLALAEGLARWTLHDMAPAREACRAAARHAVEANDIALAAAAETAAVRRHHPFVPDPGTLARLDELDALLPVAQDTVDPALRIGLRGRRAVLSLAIPERAPEALALAEDALGRARRLGDAEVLVAALSDRFAILTTPADHDGRAEAALEVLAAARRAHRPDLALLGHEWLFTSRVGRGDLTGAGAALDDLEAVAAIMPSSYWRLSAALRRAALVAMLGDHGGALALFEGAMSFPTGTMEDEERNGMECGMLIALGLLYGRVEPRLAVALGSETRGDLPSAFLQIHVAMGELLLGDHQSARRRLSAFVGRLDAVAASPEGQLTVVSAAWVCVLTGWAEPANELRRVLAPFAGRMPSGNGPTTDLSVDHHLGALALVAGDVAGAQAHAADAVTFARRSRSPLLEAHALALLSRAADRAGDRAAALSARDAAETLAEPLGVLLDPPWSSAPGPASLTASTRLSSSGIVTFALEGGRWSITSPHGDGRVADSTGMRQLLRLVEEPDVDVAAVDLAGGDSGQVAVVSSDLGAALDARAKREYRRRITELQADIDDADADDDPERATRLRLEMDAILHELRAAVGLGGRDRPQGSSNEKARINAARSIRRAIATITSAVPDLGAHLTASVRTGHRCTYAPEPAAALTWTVSHLTST